SPQSGRTDTGTRGPGVGTIGSRGTHIFGSQFIGGPWHFDGKGRVVGYFIETTTPVCATNAVPVTNAPFVSSSPVSLQTNFFEDQYCVIFPDTNTIGPVFTNPVVCFSNAVTCTATTNQISFRAKIHPGKSISLASST